jgi:hypothetical protein
MMQIPKPSLYSDCPFILEVELESEHSLAGAAGFLGKLPLDFLRYSQFDFLPLKFHPNAAALAFNNRRHYKYYNIGRCFPSPPGRPREPNGL